MKKFLAMLLVVGSLFFASTSEAAIEKYTGTGTATISESETQEQVTARATKDALRNARDQVEVYVKNFAQRNAVELGDEDISTIALGLLKLVDKKVEKISGGDVPQIRVTLTVEIDSDELQRELEDLSKAEPVAYEIKTYASEAKATMSGSETQDQVVKRAESYALKDIRYQVNIDIRTFARTRKLELTNPEVDAIAEKVLKITDKTVESSLVNFTIEVHVKVTVQLDTADLEREISELARNRQAE